MKTLEGHENWVRSLVVWNDSLYSGSDDTTIKQWVDEEAERVKQTELFAALDTCESLLQQQQNTMDDIKHISVSSLSFSQTFVGHEGAVWSLVVGNDSLYSGSGDNTILLD